MFNWVSNEFSKKNQAALELSHIMDENTNVPDLNVNNESYVGTSNELDSNSVETHLVTITRLQEKGGLGTVIRKLRTGFKKDEDMTRFWMPDSNSKECYECGFKFSTIRRKHHCRICGQIFCSKCCSQKIEGDKVGYSTNHNVRSCSYCYKAINSCVKQKKSLIDSKGNKNEESENNESFDKLNSSNQFPETLKNLFLNDDTKKRNAFSSPRKSLEEIPSISSNFLHKRRNSLSSQTEKQIKELQSTPFLLRSELPSTSRKRLFISENENFQEPAWVKEIDQKDSSSFDNLNLENDSIEVVYNLNEELNTINVIEKKMQEINSDINLHTKNDLETKFTLDNNILDQFNKDTIDSNCPNMKPNDCYEDSIKENEIDSNEVCNEELVQNKSLNDTKTEISYELQFDFIYEKLFKKLAAHLLKKNKLSFSWISILKDLSRSIINVVKANCLDEMDIRKHLKIKTITGGNKNDSCIINGIVFNKNVSHRKMKKTIENPKLLLLSCPITFQQRTNQKYISLEKVFLQENNYLENLVEKIASFKPNIIIVDKIVSIKAQNLLLKKKIIVVYNVKPNILKKISYLTEGEIIDKIDAQINCPKLGKCEKFYLQTFNNSQTLMFISGCKLDLGCTVLLRGSSSKLELKRVKKVFQFLLFCDQNWKYEKAFLTNSLVDLPQSIKNEFIEMYEIDENKSTKLETDTKNNDSIVSRKKSFVVRDNSDPLMNPSDNSQTENAEFNLKNNLTETEENEVNFFREDYDKMSKFIENLILSVSPFIKYKLPFFLTPESNECPIKNYLSFNDLFTSTLYKEYENSKKIRLVVDEPLYIKEESFTYSNSNNLHEFLNTDLIYGPNHEETQTLLALYRSNNLYKIDQFKPKQNEIKICESEQNSDECDLFNVIHHQKFPVLYCNYSFNTSQNPFCIKPVIWQIEFYQDRDFSLGGYLRKFCFSDVSKCNCGYQNIFHVHKFSHSSGSIYVKFKKLSKKVNLPNENDIISWYWCQICKSSTESRILTDDELKLSFGKYLQLKIYSKHFKNKNGQPTCFNHSIFHDHFQFFASDNMVVSFKYYPVILREIVLPPIKISLDLNLNSITNLTNELQNLRTIGFNTMSLIVEQLCNYQAESNPNLELNLFQLLRTEKSDRLYLKERIDEIQELINQQDTTQNRLIIQDKLIFLKQLISTFVNDWNNRLNEYETIRKKDDKFSVINIKFSRHNSFEPGDNLNLNLQNSFYNKQVVEHHLVKESIETSKSIETIKHELNKDKLLEIKTDVKSFSNVKDDFLNAENERFDNYLEDQLEILNKENEKFSKFNEKLNEIEERSNENDESESIKSVKILENLNEISDIKKSASHNSISSIAFGITPGIKACLGKEIIQNSESDKENYEIVNCFESLESIKNQDQNHDEDENYYQNQNNNLNQVPSNYTSSKPNIEIDNLSSSPIKTSYKSQLQVPIQVIANKKEPIRQSMKSLINNLLSSSNAPIILDPLPSFQHYLLPIREKLPICVDENDFGSIIAYSLTTLEYEKKLAELQSSKLNSAQIKRYSNNGNVNSFTSNELMKDTLSAELPNNTYSYNLKEPVLNDHINLQFNDSTTTFYCCVYFAVQFRRLRSEVIKMKQTFLNPASTNTSLNSTLTSKTTQSNKSKTNIELDLEELYIRSISETVKWSAKGGKSKASFSKTLNDRFVIKIVKKQDLQLFSQMGNSYFDYIHKTMIESKPTLFSKIIGAYDISWKNTLTGTAFKKHVLVMENVFYDRKIKQKFDLKGSEKNRLALTKTSDDVLLDENLTKIIRDNPLYIRKYSKMVFQAAIDNDSRFLCDLNVIDYSLLVGIDEEKKEIVVAIIDYIQTYTNIKKIETVIKSMGKVMPTVVDPQSYMERFQEKMDEYFQCLPDQWYDFDIYKLK